uniref:FkbM family methyltransferase n=1 Tax=Thermodesulfobacterium geofontis TaxID=1295609 RepID=A0A7C4NSV2_9BACT
MISLIKKGLKLILPKEVYKNLADFKNTYISKYSLKSYSQEGGKKEDLLTFYIFNEPALNTFNENLAKQRDGVSGYFIIQKIPVKVYPLAKILEEYLPKGQEIDFMNIDVEGKDLEVLKSNDWNKFRPKVILVEILSSSLEEVFDNSTYTFLNENNYSLFAKTFNTCFFIENKFLEFLR